MPDRLFVFHLLGQQAQLAFRQHVRHQGQVLCEPHRPGLESRDQSHLVQPSGVFHRVEERPVEGHDRFRLFADASRPQRLFAQVVHHTRNVDLLRTTRNAILAVQAEPYRVRAEHLPVVLFAARLQHPQHEARRIVHLRGRRASGRAFAALIATGDIYAGISPHFVGHVIFVFHLGII